MAEGWRFTGKNGDFVLDSPHRSSYLYFPLVSESGMISSIAPNLGGDIKTGQNTFFSIPVSAIDLHNSRSGRNFWVYIHGKRTWSAAGASAPQTGKLFSDNPIETVRLEAGFLWHRLIRENATLGIKSEITSFVTTDASKTEFMCVRITNTSHQRMTITPTAAIPVYGRSAGNIRDHRHVTGLLTRIYTSEFGMEVRPVMTFDERGHKRNTISYKVYGADEAGMPPSGSFPRLDGFIGEGGYLDWPEAVVRNLGGCCPPGCVIEGYEAVGALRFKDRVLMPGESVSYIVTLSVTEGTDASTPISLNKDVFDRLLAENMKFWQAKLGSLCFHSSDEKFDLWMKWVTLQPILRRICGCSFMPHHDYGKGGRGWRDLWQDCLGLLLMEPRTVRAELLNNFGGVRVDGTNATIIGLRPGEFKADRNNIARVWSDHGVWPFFTTLLYINQSGDLEFLLEHQTYFKDGLAMRARVRDDQWAPSDGCRQRTVNGEVYEGTILEHLLLQNLAAFYNVGENNNIRLENADWNDALDMAQDKGETVAFTAFYAGNLVEMAKLLRHISDRKSFESIELGDEICMLLDTIQDGSGHETLVDYNSVGEKTLLLKKFCEACRHTVSGRKKVLDPIKVASDLEKKASWLIEHIRGKEWVSSSEGYEWFNGYYDNMGTKVEGENSLGTRMTLTGQVFPIMMGAATDEQARKAAASADHYLYDGELGGYRLNTDFKEMKLDLGRCFGFAYGHKENGSVFSHMAVMYAAALYRRGLIKEGHRVVKSIYRMSTNFQKARIYPGIPEYFDGMGRGVYHYLTGSASWLLLVLLNDVYGVRGRLGDLYIKPCLELEQFDPGRTAQAETFFAGRRLEIVYKNPEALEYGEYSPKSISLDGAPVGFAVEEGGAVIGRNVLEQTDANKTHRLEVRLGR